MENEKAGSFLADYLKEEYSFVRTIEEADADEKKILVNQDGSTNFEDSKHGKAQLSYAVQEFDKLLETYLPKTRKEKVSRKALLPRPPREEKKDDAPKA